MSDELKPCPFCGHEFDANVMERGKIMGSCSNKMCIAYGLFCSVEEWNTRPVEDKLCKELFDTKTNMAQQILQLQTELFVEREKRDAWQSERGEVER